MERHGCILLQILIFMAQFVRSLVRHQSCSCHRPPLLDCAGCVLAVCTDPIIAPAAQNGDAGASISSTLVGAFSLISWCNTFAEPCMENTAPDIVILSRWLPLYFFSLVAFFLLLLFPSWLHFGAAGPACCFTKSPCCFLLLLLMFLTKVCSYHENALLHFSGFQIA